MSRRFVILTLVLASLPPLVAREPDATDPASLKVAKGFQVELLYSVPKDRQGSWVNLCSDPKGRLIVCDQYGGLFRVTPPALGGKSADTKIEPIPVPLGEAQGLLWAFDSLYVVVNRGQKYASGLYRVRDTNGDDMLDKVEMLRPINGGGEHGPHAVVLHPDGKRLVIVCGNQTKLTQISRTRVPTIWGEDHLLPRMPDGRGFMKGVLGPGGAIYFVDPEGKDWELYSVGYRNQYDAAFNRDGDLFTYDADMEWDFNTPWYRPTRVCHVTSGSEWGWRNGAGKWPTHYPDTLPPVVDIGPGSPTGVCFGHGAKFPVKYENAFYICDWSYGKLYAIHLAPKGSTYTAEIEEFVTGSPLPLTDVIVNPVDGAMYFTIGGRRTKSGLYRVTYTAPIKPEPTAAPQNLGDPAAKALRQKLEALHDMPDPKQLDMIWSALDHSDRFVRYAARTALEFLPAQQWMERALGEKSPGKAIAALLALARVGGQDPFHHPNRVINTSLRDQMATALTVVASSKLSDDHRLDLMRVCMVFFNRFGPPTAAQNQAMRAVLSPQFPTSNRLLNGDMTQVLVYLQDPTVAAKATKLLTEAPTQEEQMEYARALRVLRAGWTMPLREEYFRWFVRAANFRGGMSFVLFVANIKNDALATLTPAELASLQPIINARPETAPRFTARARPKVKEYSVAELAAVLDAGLKERDFDRGRRLFGEASCFACHRFDNEGGANGPDLSGVAGRFSKRDLLESIIEPSKVISDQYQSVNVETTDGKQIHGRIVNHNGDSVMINTDMLDPAATVNVDRRRIETMEASKTSMMPTGLLDTLKEDEILDLMAYLLSRGDRKNPMFKQ